MVQRDSMISSAIPVAGPLIVVSDEVIVFPSWALMYLNDVYQLPTRRVATGLVTARYAGDR
jgi:hypothetical protein